MAKDLLLGIDIGTTATKAVLFSADGKMVAQGQAEYPLIHLRPGWVEQDPADWWKATCTATRQALSGVNDGGARVAAVGVSAQGPACLPLDADGNPLRNGMIWMDRRAEAEVAELNARFGAGAIFKRVGNRSDAFYVAPKLLWLRHHEPDTLARTHKFVQVSGYIVHRLTGMFTLDSVFAWFTQLFDHQTGAWWDEMGAYCGVEPRQFPDITPCHEIIGAITPAAAEATGLAAGTPVVSGTIDAAAATLEAGCLAPGVSAEMTGTSTSLMLPNREKLTDFSLIAFQHPVPGTTILCGATVASGANLRWFRDEFGQVEQEAADRLRLDAFDLLTQQAAGVAPGSDGVLFLPYMMGERSPIWHTNARGVFFGMSLATSRAALIRSILEGVAFSVRHIVEVATAAGVRCDEVRVVGGGSRSELWNQIKADVLGIPVTLPEASVGAPFGVAILAGMGLNWYTDVEQTLDDMIAIRARYEPNSDHHARYSALYRIYRDLYDHTRDDFDRLAAVNAELR